MRKTSTTVRLKLGAAVVFISVAASGFGTNPRLGSPAKGEKDAMNRASVGTQTDVYGARLQAADQGPSNSNKEVAAEINRLGEDLEDDDLNGCKGSLIQQLHGASSGEKTDLEKKVKDSKFIVVDKSRTNIDKEALWGVISETEFFPGGPKVVVYAKK